MPRSIRDLTRDVTASPLGDVIASVAEGVAAAQQALDDASISRTLEIYTEGGPEALKLLREMGYRPTFYALPETTGEVRVALSLSGQGTQGTPARQPAAPAVAADFARTGRNVAVPPRLYATPVDAGYQNRFGYRAEISAKLTFRIVPVPAPDGADELRVVPDLIGRPGDAATATLADFGLVAEPVDVEGAPIDAQAPERVVAEQFPAGGTILRARDTVRLILSNNA